MAKQPTNYVYVLETKYEGSNRGVFSTLEKAKAYGDSCVLGKHSILNNISQIKMDDPVKERTIATQEKTDDGKIVWRDFKNNR